MLESIRSRICWQQTTITKAISGKQTERELEKGVVQKKHFQMSTLETIRKKILFLIYILLISLYHYLLYMLKYRVLTSVFS